MTDRPATLHRSGSEPLGGAPGWIGTGAVFGLVAWGIGLGPGVSALVAGAAFAQGYALRGLSFRVQALIVWIEILVLLIGLFARFNLSAAYMWERLPSLIGVELRDGFIQGASLTLFISVVSTALASALALVFALLRLSPNPAAFALGGFYVSFFRGTPLLLQAMVIYLGLPQLGLVIDAIPAGILALTLCYGAYLAEIFRAGIEAIPRGQREAAQALGLGPAQTMRLVILPQALRLIIPPTGNQFISMLKDSALVSVMGVWELTFIARTHGRASFKYMEMMIAAGLIYWLLSALFEILQARIEARYGKGVSV